MQTHVFYLWPTTTPPLFSFYLYKENKRDLADFFVLLAYFTILLEPIALSYLIGGIYFV